MTPYLGLDIGGANLKAANTKGQAISVPFALWRNQEGLPEALGDLANRFPNCRHLAVTMTGELCDCFETKKQGVNFILDAVQSIPRMKSIRVWQTNGQFVAPSKARKSTLKTAAANWFALATYAGRFSTGESALLIDIGSTTTDLIPMVRGNPCPQGLTDMDRLKTMELVYTGVTRTPVCAVGAGRTLYGIEMAAELFATMLDVYLVKGLIEDQDHCDTADGRPATVKNAHARLARMLGGDTSLCSIEEIGVLASRISLEQQSKITKAMWKVKKALPTPPQQYILSGVGEFLAREIIWEDHKIVSLGEKLGPEISSAACAYAVAILAEEMANGSDSC